MRTHKQLRKELLLAGASPAETQDLLPIASRLSSLQASKKASRWLSIIKPAAFTATGLALGAFLIITAQAVSANSWLYPVQKFSDHVAISVHPQYRANVMMKRAQQVNQLVAAHASPQQVLATLADYTREASTYKTMPHANYAAFEYCKTNLQQALAASTLSVHQAIASSLQSLENI